MHPTVFAEWGDTPEVSSDSNLRACCGGRDDVYVMSNVAAQAMPGKGVRKRKDAQKRVRMDLDQLHR
jgi:hypothetical protein